MINETIVLEGHIINSLALSRVLDTILELGGNFAVDELRIGKKSTDPSFAQITVSAPNETTLGNILGNIQKLGAVVKENAEVQYGVADIDGSFPENFYSTTNLDTFVFYKGKWIPVEIIEMDCGILLDIKKITARCIAINEVKKGDLIVVGHQGVKVVPLPRAREKEIFSFMTSSVSSEKPKKLIIGELAQRMKSVRKNNGKILLVGGPAIVHTGAGKHLSALIRAGYINVLFAGNALAVHDIESALFGTSLGISLQDGAVTTGGHRNHLRAINTIRRLGSAKSAVEKKVLQQGIIYECIKNHIPFVLAGSIRDDGPLPEVITDVMHAQKLMREYAQQVEMALLLATTLHSIATGNVLPARVFTVCVDINHAVVTKLIDRGSAQTLGIVTDVESFLRELVGELITTP
ncbi:MAG: TIGR00300 family protein [bacterium]|nr:TIGR00300 family protein [bacterium]